MSPTVQVPFLILTPTSRGIFNMCAPVTNTICSILWLLSGNINQLSSLGLSPFVFSLAIFQGNICMSPLWNTDHHIFKASKSHSNSNFALFHGVLAMMFNLMPQEIYPSHWILPYPALLLITSETHPWSPLMVLVGLVGMTDNSCHFKVYIIYFLYQPQLVQTRLYWNLTLAISLVARRVDGRNS